MASQTVYEQYLLELTNQARMDPLGEYARLVTYAPANVLDAIRYFNVDLNLLKYQFNDLTAAAPLAWNEQLAAAARQHSAVMIHHDAQSHHLPGELPLGQRTDAAGYDYQRVGENIYAYSEDAFYAHAGFFIDWGNEPGGIQAGAGHRANIMSAAFREVGMGNITELNPATQVGPEVVTQNFGARFGYQPQLTGVAISDRNGNAFYDIGEGLGGVLVVARGATGTYSTQTWESGGYNLAVPAGNYDVTFTLNGRSVTRTTSIRDDNVKIDANFAISLPAVDNGTQDSVFDIARFYNTQTGAHFYTANDDERDFLIANGGSLVSEGNVFDSNATASDGISMFRFYNMSTGVHFYTANAAEADAVRSDLPNYLYEGVAYRAYAEDANGRMALYRVYNTDTNTHFYTANADERADVIARLPSSTTRVSPTMWISLRSAAFVRRQTLSSGCKML